VLGGDVLERDLDVLLGQVHLGGEGGVGLPLARSAGCGLLHHLVDLLERKSLCLGNEEVGEEDFYTLDRCVEVWIEAKLTRNTAQSTPHEEDVGAELGGAGALSDQVRCDDGDDAVPEPLSIISASSRECSSGENLR
jgi:hypothetical protein